MTKKNNLLNVNEKHINIKRLIDWYQFKAIEIDYLMYSNWWGGIKW